MLKERSKLEQNTWKGVSETLESDETTSATLASADKRESNISVARLAPNYASERTRLRSSAERNLHACFARPT